MEDQASHASLTPVGRPLNLVPVGLKEAALDSPSFRSTAVFFGDQIELIERWLDNWVKATSKLAAEASVIEGLVNNFLSHASAPQQISEAVVDHDYTLLAAKRYGEVTREFWAWTFRGLKRVETSISDPIRGFLQNDLRVFKDARRNLDITQKAFDGLLARYVSQGKSKEPSSLREDAFQLHEARKAYLKASMDFCVIAPQVRATLDKLLVGIYADQWKDMADGKKSREEAFARSKLEIDRVRGWSKEMEISEKAFKKELQMARKQIEESAEAVVRPSRELDDYSTSTVPFIGSQPAGATSIPGLSKAKQTRAEKQGWLFLKTVTGKPARTMWVRRWFFVKNGIFSWLVQGLRSGGVEESDKIGVLLCSVRPASQEERRFCFEVKTKDSTIVLQAETQGELSEWISAFEMVKRKAIEDPDSTEGPRVEAGTDPAFAITPPIAPEFTAKASEGHGVQSSEDFAGPDRAGTLGLPGGETLASRSSFDVTGRRSMMGGDREGESSRDHAARIIQKLDLHRKTTATSQVTGSPNPGGIASLITASHGVLPVGPGTPVATTTETRSGAHVPPPASSLAPSTLVNPPAPTTLSNLAVVISSERGLGVGRTDRTGGMPGSLMANMWGSTNWGYINRLERGEVRSAPPVTGNPIKQNASGDTARPGVDSGPPSVEEQGTSSKPQGISGASAVEAQTSAGTQPKPSSNAQTADSSSNATSFPNYYPLSLKAQDAQFRILFPNVPREERVVLVFHATWNPNMEQEFPGRVYVTTKEIYFYSHHLGLVLISGVSLSAIGEVTAAPGRDCDFLYLHMKETDQKVDFTRLTIKTFLDPLKLLQKRLNFLVQNANAAQPETLGEVLKKLIKMEAEIRSESESLEDWEHVASPRDEGASKKLSGRAHQDMKGSIRIDGTLYGETPSPAVKEVIKFKLPNHPVIYTPQGFNKASVEREFHISAKSLFHLMFGDKSVVFPLLYRDRQAQQIMQSPWTQPVGGLMRRDFAYSVQDGAQTLKITDYQTIDVANDHLCYVITDRKTPWHLPYGTNYILQTKVVITHVAKSRCKLAIFTKVDWQHRPFFFTSFLQRQAIRELDLGAEDLLDVVIDQVVKLGHRSNTNHAVQIFGYVGQQKQAIQIQAADFPPVARKQKLRVKRRTILGLLFRDYLRLLQRWIAFIIECISGVWSSVIGLITGHILLLGLLIGSGLWNTWYMQRDGLQWWRERHATKFLSRVGVKPNSVIGRGIWLHDIDQMFLNDTSELLHMPTAQPNACLSSFTHLLDQSELATAPTISTSLSTYEATQRLHRTRQSLGAQRHDLLIAMRMVNRVEKEAIQMEWENWVWRENRRCAQMQHLAESSDATNTTANDTSSEPSLAAELAEPRTRDWLSEYCGSCRSSWQALEDAGMTSAL